jgi:hypothetical protein
MKVFKIYALSLIALALVITSCQKDQNTQSVLDDPAEPSTGEIISNQEENFIASLDINVDDISLGEFVFPDGTSEERYFLDGDISMAQEQYKELIGEITGMELEQRQYRTYNLCYSPQTIKIIGYTGGGGYGLTNKMKTALGWAVNNYNALNTGLNFTLTYGTNYNNKDMVVYRVPNGQAGGVAGFPYSNGKPYKWVQIFSGMDNYNTNTNEHVITHEIGHCVGLRHTDWFNRISCGGSGEAANPNGAVHIPGTPTGVDYNSVMLACFSSNEDGEFGNNDKNALEYLY